MSSDPRNLDRTLIRGLSWNAAGKWIGQMVSWGSTLVVVRLLTPEDYGLVAMSTILVALVSMLADAGIGLAIVNRREADPLVLDELMSFCLGLGSGGLAIAVIAAFPLSWFFSEPRLVPLVSVTGITFPLIALRVVPLATLQRDLRYRSLAVNDLLMAVSSAGTSVAIALAGGGYWALVGANLVASTVACIGAWRLAPRGFARIRWEHVRNHVIFGAERLAGTVTSWAQTSSQSAVVGRLQGQQVLGAFTVAVQLANLPIDKLASIIGQTAHPLIASIKDDTVALNRYLLLLSEGLALVVWPLAIGIVLLADLGVSVALGDQWVTATAPLRVFACIAVPRALLPIFITAALHRGYSRQLVSASLCSLTLTLLGLWIWRAGTLSEIALAVGVATLLPSLWIATVVARDVGISWTTYARRLGPITAAVAFEIVAVLALRRAAGPGRSELSVLLVCIVAGAVGYLAGLWLFARERIKLIRSNLRPHKATNRA